MDVKSLSPILNVSNILDSFKWFESFGWSKGFEWGTPVGFGSVCSGDCEIFLCEGGQGGRGRGANTTTFGPGSVESADRGVWMSLWVDDIDKAHEQCRNNKLDITWPPTDMPWGVREMHVRHPDGHVFRVSTSTLEESTDQ